MFRPSSKALNASRLKYLLVGVVVWGLQGQQVLAHNVQIDDQVAATFHLEPNHNPKAGEVAKLWFALTKKGGEAIALADCDCQLMVQQKDQLVATPSLSALDVEKYKGIPAANYTFPAVGLYNLRLSGRPKAGNGFNPFNLNYEVTVQAGNKVSEISPKGQTENPPEEGNRPVNLLPIALGVGAIGLIATLSLLLGGKRNEP
jgi:hypothetical protein